MPDTAPPADVTHLVAHYERWGDERAYLLAQEARVAATSITKRGDLRAWLPASA
jgi:hypothetical protein